MKKLARYPDKEPEFLDGDKMRNQMEVAMRKKIFLMVLVGLGFSLNAQQTLYAQDSDKVVILSPRIGVCN